MSKVLSLVLILSVIGCSKSGDTPAVKVSTPNAPNPMWTISDMQGLNDQCVKSQELTSALNNAANQVAICQCFVEKTTSKYTPAQIASSDAAIEKDEETLLAGCAQASGENVTFAALTTIRGFRFLNNDSGTSFSKALKKVKPKAAPPTHVPAPVIEIAPKPPVTPPTSSRPQAPARIEVDEKMQSISQIQKDNRLVFTKKWEVTDEDSGCFKADRISCCLKFRERTPFPVTFKSNDSIVFSGSGTYTTPREAPPVTIGGRSYYLHSEYEALNPALADVPNASIAFISSPSHIQQLVCKKWNPVYRRTVNVTIDEMKLAIQGVAEYEHAGKYKDHPEVVEQPVTQVFPMPPAVVQPEETKKEEPAAELPVYNMKRFSVRRSADGYEAYQANNKALIVKKEKNGYVVKGYFSYEKKGGYQIGRGPQTDVYRGNNISIQSTGSTDHITATLNDGTELNSRFEKPTDEQEQKVRTNELIEMLNYKRQHEEDLAKDNYTRASKEYWPDLYKKGGSLFYLGTNAVPQPIVKNPSGGYTTKGGKPQDNKVLTKEVEAYRKANGMK